MREREEREEGTGHVINFKIIGGNKGTKHVDRRANTAKF